MIARFVGVRSRVGDRCIELLGAHSFLLVDDAFVGSSARTVVQSQIFLK
jgi:hypothetical protein